MKVPVALGAGLALALAVLATAIEGPSPTGPTKPDKPSTSTAGAIDSVAHGVDWLSRSEEETVAGLVYGPVKLLGLGSFTPEARVELKTLMRRTEERIRDIHRAVGRTELGTTAARAALDDTYVEYRTALERLSAVRWPTDAPPR